MNAKKIKYAKCPNCQYDFVGDENFCPRCGQENHDLKVPFKHLFMEVLESFFHFDGKFFTTLKVLFLYPGRLTKEFVDGKRMKYVPPIRLYVFSSFIFYLMLSMQWNQPVQSRAEAKETVKTLDSLNILSADDVLEINAKIDDSASISEQVMADSTQPEWVKIVSVNAEKEMQKEDHSEFIHRIIKYASYAVLFFLPIMALLLYAMYFKSKKYFYEYLIFALHFHVILYILLTIAMLLSACHAPGKLFLVLYTSAFIYFTLSLKTFFERSWGSSIRRAIFILLVYSCCISILVVISSLIALYH